MKPASFLLAIICLFGSAAFAAGAPSTLKLQVKCALKASEFFVRGGEHYLLKSGDIAQLECEKGWDGPRVYYKQRLTIIKGDEEFLEMPSAKIAERFTSKAPETQRVLEFKKLSECERLQNKCHLEHTKGVTIMLTPLARDKQYSVRDFDCERLPPSAQETTCDDPSPKDSVRESPQPNGIAR